MNERSSADREKLVRDAAQMWPTISGYVNDRKARSIVTDWLGMFDPPPQIDFQQSELLQGAISAALRATDAAATRDAFEAWAASDNRTIQPLEFEDRSDNNNHYYESDSDNNAFIGWKARTIDPDQCSRDSVIEECAKAVVCCGECDCPEMSRRAILALSDTSTEDK